MSIVIAKIYLYNVTKNAAYAWHTYTLLTQTMLFFSKKAVANATIPDTFRVSIVESSVGCIAFDDIRNQILEIYSSENYCNFCK